eukprot:jgi/Botrbrau1/22320/Bobra.0002s0002.1
MGVLPSLPWEQKGRLLSSILLSCLQIAASQSTCPPVTAERPEARTDDNYGLKWLQEHASLVTQMALNDTLLGGYKIIFYGDDIFENFLPQNSGMGWAGTPSSKDNGSGATAFAEYFAKKYKSGVFAVSGDQVVNVWWRFKNGEAPIVNKPAVVVVLVGGNDLSALACNGATADRLLAAVPEIAYKIKSMLKDMRSSMPDAQFIVAAQLPRGTGINDPGLRYVWPNQYTLPILALNSDIQQFANLEPWAHYVDCGAQFLSLTYGIGAIRHELMPDALSPSTMGMETLVSCLAPIVQNLVFSHSDTNTAPMGAPAPFPHDVAPYPSSAGPQGATTFF